MLVPHGVAHRGDPAGEKAADAAAADAVGSWMSRRVLLVHFMVVVVCYLNRTHVSLPAVGMSKDIGLS